MSRRRGSSLAGAVALAVAGCSAAPALPQLDPGLANLALFEVHPAIVLPGTTIDLVGQSFVDNDAGLGVLHVEGTFAPSAGPPRDVRLDLPLAYVDPSRYRVGAAVNAWALLGGGVGRLTGVATLAVDSAVDQSRHPAAPIPIDLRLAAALTPTVDGVVSGTIRVNQELTVTGSGFLLGEGEGETRVVVSGCYLAQGHASPCATYGTTLTDVEIPAHPSAPWDRGKLLFPFAPSVAGIHPGSFDGKIRVRNVPKAAAAITSPASVALAAKVRPPVLTQLTPSSASLGQYVDVTGGGFVGGAAGLITLVRLNGSFTPEGAITSLPVDIDLLPRFVAGGRLRYVLDEADELGQRVNLRQTAGKFVGTAQPILRLGEDQESGAATPVNLSLAHVRQVVYVRFAPSYVESLRDYGLRAADDAIRNRVFAVAARDYQGVNVEWRRTPPTDYALYSQVDVLGPDPNGLDLLGYDNTPGKDVGNSRLFDRIGGVNAQTQEDGFPGFGGIFAQQFLGFSSHPPPSVSKLPFKTALFDAVFDPLRPDTGGRPATPMESAQAKVMTTGAGCPTADRADQVACAIFVLGNLIGTTLTHEVGHSLGLANPYGDGFHDVGDKPNRLMDAGGDRPYEERAELAGQGPGRFCDAEYTYLRAILPSTAAAPKLTRPTCN